MEFQKIIQLFFIAFFSRPLRTSNNKTINGSHMIIINNVQLLIVKLKIGKPNSGSDDSYINIFQLIKIKMFTKIEFHSYYKKTDLNKIKTISSQTEVEIIVDEINNREISCSRPLFREVFCFEVLKKNDLAKYNIFINEFPGSKSDDTQVSNILIQSKNTRKRLKRTSMVLKTSFEPNTPDIIKQNFNFLESKTSKSDENQNNRVGSLHFQITKPQKFVITTKQRKAKEKMSRSMLTLNFNYFDGKNFLCFKNFQNGKKLSEAEVQTLKEFILARTRNKTYCTDTSDIVVLIAGVSNLEISEKTRLLNFMKKIKNLDHEKFYGDLVVLNKAFFSLKTNDCNAFYSHKILCILLAVLIFIFFLLLLLIIVVEIKFGKRKIRRRRMIELRLQYNKTILRVKHSKKGSRQKKGVLCHLFRNERRW